MEGSVRNIDVNGKNIEYILTRKNVKNINLRIRPDGKILVSANKRVSLKYLDDFIKSKSEFICQTLSKFSEAEKKIIMPVTYSNGEKIKILGRVYELKVEESKNEKIILEDKYLYIYVNNINNTNRKEKLVLKWEQEEQDKLFHSLCKEIYIKFKEYNVKYPIIKLRYMTSQWGSCQPTRGIITLNRKLYEKPVESIEYVILHEFAHFIHPNHSNSFYEFVEKLMPDWKARKQGLEK